MSRDLIQEAREAVARAKLIVENARAALESARRTRDAIEASRRSRRYPDELKDGAPDRENGLIGDRTVDPG
jgi:hypothetical protein